MEYAKDKVDEMVMALLYLRTYKGENGLKAWKSMDWSCMERLFEKGYISDPKTAAASVAWTDGGFALAQQLFKKRFGAASPEDEK